MWDKERVKNPSMIGRWSTWLKVYWLVVGETEVSVSMVERRGT
jgi:hypothetical protein